MGWGSQCAPPELPSHAQRKSLRERWLMDGTAEGTERQESASKDPQSPEGQAQARIQNLEDSLFTLQSQLQLLQGASTGAQHKSSGRPTWRRQVRGQGSKWVVGEAASRDKSRISPGAV